MQLKHRVPLFFSLLFSVVLASVMTIVYFLFSNFRQIEFRDRLVQQAETSIKLLLEVKEVDEQLLKIIDRNSINKLYNEKILIFNDQLQLIYSSIDDAVVPWRREDLEAVKKHQQVFRHEKEYDILWLYYRYNGRDFFTATSAEDIYGISKLRYLKILLVGAFLVSTSIVWLISFYLSRKALQPLDQLRRQMQDITSNNLMLRVQEPKAHDEIKVLSKVFNQMLDRLDKAYKNQKDFTSNASHELRTPVARITMQLENVLKENVWDDGAKATLRSTLEDIHQLSDIITSLLLLSRIDEVPGAAAFKMIRLDEVIFKTAARIARLHPDFKLQFEINNPSAADLSMEVRGDETLLEIAISNLLSNAYAYSSNQTVRCMLEQNDTLLQLTMINHGEVPTHSDTAVLFDTFTRGANSKSKPGSGIGLSIVRRILQYHQADIVYTIPNATTNQIVMSFSRHPAGV